MYKTLEINEIEKPFFIGEVLAFSVLENEVPKVLLDEDFNGIICGACIEYKGKNLILRVPFIDENECERYIFFEIEPKDFSKLESCNENYIVDDDEEE